jgi:hypothetical protein
MEVKVLLSITLPFLNFYEFNFKSYSFSRRPLTWALMGEKGCPVECERVYNSEALAKISLEKNTREPYCYLVSLYFFQFPT